MFQEVKHLKIKDFYCAACDGAFYKDKEAAVIGGGNSALDDALLLSDICKKVYLIHRRNEFRGNRSTLARLEKKKMWRLSEMRM